MNDDPDRDAEAVGGDVLESLAGVVAVGTLGVGVTSAVLGYGGLTALIFVVGWLLLLPLVGVLSDSSTAQTFVGRLFGARTNEREDQGVDEEAAALEELKRRYARGEIDEAEFERRTALLLENQSIDHVQSRVDREQTHATGTTEERAEVRRDHEREFET